MRRIFGWDNDTLILAKSYSLREEVLLWRERNAPGLLEQAPGPIQQTCDFCDMAKTNMTRSGF